MPGSIVFSLEMLTNTFEVVVAICVWAVIYSIAGLKAVSESMTAELF
jgi:hypothetical protein